LGNLGQCPTGESPLQVVDEVRGGSAVVFLDECHLPITPHVFGLATGFGDRDCPLVVVDPLLNPLAVLGEQTHEVLSLLIVGRCRRGRGQRGDRLALRDMN
jgi:hypothetical protein